jgi:hypothetical protein
MAMAIQIPDINFSGIQIFLVHIRVSGIRIPTVVNLFLAIHPTLLTFINSPKLVELLEFKDSRVLVNTVFTEIVEKEKTASKA